MFFFFFYRGAFLACLISRKDNVTINYARQSAQRYRKTRLKQAD